MKALAAFLATVLTALLIIVAFTASVLWFMGLAPNAWDLIAAAVVTAALWYTLFGAVGNLLK